MVQCIESVCVGTVYLNSRYMWYNVFKVFICIGTVYLNSRYMWYNVLKVFVCISTVDLNSVPSRGHLFITYLHHFCQAAISVKISNLLICVYSFEFSCPILKIIF